MNWFTVAVELIEIFAEFCAILILLYLAPFCLPSEFHIIVAIDVLDYDVLAASNDSNEDNIVAVVVVVVVVDDDDDDVVVVNDDDEYCSNNDVDNIKAADIFWLTMIQYPDTAKKGCKSIIMINIETYI